jgi:CRISPR-associated endoribonuclease Cas6
MRIKISFLRDQASSNSIPLHHQKLLSATLHEIASAVSTEQAVFNFSSIKGTSRIQNGFMKFLSTKVTLVISSPDENFLQKFVDEIFTRPYITIGKMNLIPKHKENIADPDFQKRMRYLCISPIVLLNPNLEPDKAQEMVSPVSHEFSDALFNGTLDRMEANGYSDEKLSQYAEFEVKPDREYVEKITDSGKKFARFYKSSEGNTMMGYLLPFTLYAHPEVHEFIWKNGAGVLTEQGYGMIDIVQ